uniref:Uncharacterized protein n=1 Tax=Rhizophora mucronata TaxID=61149 RepID=A0A2P2LRH1_RHIMU
MFVPLFLVMVLLLPLNSNLIPLSFQHLHICPVLFNNPVQSVSVLLI